MKKIRNERKNLKFYSTQDVNNRDIDAIIRVLRSDHLSRGPKVEEFEEKLGKICDNRNALTVNSATSALHLAYMLAGVNSESLLWTSPITFVATTNAALQLSQQLQQPQHGNCNSSRSSRSSTQQLQHSNCNNSRSKQNTATATAVAANAALQLS